uniref:Acyltransferase 3 domain-containing protein n=1 Tax=Alexandrium monilatum TaxID=311494 RepID=A0A6T1MB48_9DINO
MQCPAAAAMGRRRRPLAGRAARRAAGLWPGAVALGAGLAAAATARPGGRTAFLQPGTAAGPRARPRTGALAGVHPGAGLASGSTTAGLVEPGRPPIYGMGLAAAASAALAAGTRRHRSGHSTGAVSTSAEGGKAEAAEPPKPKKVRITAFDSIRFFLITYIVCGHFVSFAAPSAFAFRAVTQINVVVGAFFALSGYVAAYTSTENAERAASPKLLGTPPPKWALQRIFGYYPLHLLALVLFAPIFIYPDVLFSGLPTAIGNGLLALTMTQAWFPMHAEVWNAPTWFLSALTFAMVVLPYALRVLAKQSKPELRRTAGFLFLVGLLPKLGYCYDHNAWWLLEGALAPRAMPNLAIFNSQRFNPFYAVIEVLLGVVACRLVMLDGAKDEEEAPKTGSASVLLPLVGMAGVILLRATGVLALSDMLTRAVIFIPLFLLFLMAAHRASVLPKVQDPIVKLLSSKLLVTFGGLSFPMFIIHGPIGQLFYKKIIATKLWGGPLHVVCGPWFFYVYLALVLGSAWLIQKTFLSSKKVGSLSKAVVGRLCKAF